jgi:serine/threonine protein kinase
MAKLCHMTVDEYQKKWLLMNGWFDEATLSQISARCPANFTGDLCQLLQSYGLLAPEQAESARGLASQLFHGQRVEGVRGYESSGRLLIKALDKFNVNAKLEGLDFAGYRILGEINRGGMGVVLKVTHPDFEKTLAMKVLQQAYHDSVVTERFRREASILKAFEHPNIVKVYDYGVVDEVPFYVMEWIEGQSLDHILGQGAEGSDGVPDFDWTASIFEGLADALVYCHDNGIIHRDVKPGNVIVERQTLRPILVDFGIVRRERRGALEDGVRFDSNSMTLSHTGEVHGTPAYMSPEQLEPGRFGQVSARSDVWGLGATLFQCLTGVSPYEHAGPNLYLALIERNPPRVRDLNREVPYWLDQLTSRCLQRIVSKRPSMSQVLLDLLSPGSSQRGGYTRLALVFMVIVLLSLAGFIWRSQDLQDRELFREYTTLIEEGVAIRQRAEGSLRLWSQDFGSANLSELGRVRNELMRAQLLSTRGEQALFNRFKAEDLGRGDPGLSSVESLDRSVRAFQLLIKIHNGQLKADSGETERAVRLLRNESSATNLFVTWAHGVRSFKAGDLEEAYKQFSFLRAKKFAERYALKQLADLQFIRKSWHEADDFARELFSLESSPAQKNSWLLRRAIIQIRLKKKAKARALLSAVSVGPVALRDRENALRLTLYLGQYQHIKTFLSGQTVEQRRLPYASIANVWNELALGHPGQARRLLKYLPLTHSKRFLRAYSYLVKARVHRYFFEEIESTVCLDEVRFLNESLQNTLLKLRAEAVAISNFIADYETVLAMGALKRLEEALPEELGESERRFLGALNLTMGDAARFRHLIDARDVGRNYMYYYERAFKLSRSDEARGRLAIFALLKGDKEGAGKHLGALDKKSSKSSTYLLAKALYYWPESKDHFDVQQLKRSLDFFVKSRDSIRPMELTRLQQDMECRLVLAFKNGYSADTNLLQKMVNRSSEMNALDPRTIFLAWQVFTEIRLPGLAADAARKFAFVLDPPFMGNWGSYAMASKKSRIPELDRVISYNRQSRAYPERHDMALSLVASVLASRDKSRALYYARMLFDRDRNVLPNLRLLKSLLDSKKDHFELGTVDRAIRERKRLGLRVLKKARIAYNAGNLGMTIELCQRCVQYLPVRDRSIRDRLYGHSLLRAGSAKRLEAFHSLSRASLTECEALILLLEEGLSVVSIKEHKRLASRSYPRARTKLDRDSERLRVAYHRLMRLVGTSDRDAVELGEIEQAVDGLLVNHSDSVGLRLMKACVLFARGYVYEAISRMDLVLLKARYLDPRFKCFVYSIARIFHGGAGDKRVVNDFTTKIRNCRIKNPKLPSANGFLSKLKVMGP